MPKKLIIIIKFDYFFILKCISKERASFRSLEWAILIILPWFPLPIHSFYHLKYSGRSWIILDEEKSVRSSIIEEDYQRRSF